MLFFSWSWVLEISLSSWFSKAVCSLVRGRLSWVLSMLSLEWILENEIPCWEKGSFIPRAQCWLDSGRGAFKPQLPYFKRVIQTWQNQADIPSICSVPHPESIQPYSYFGFDKSGTHFSDWIKKLSLRNVKKMFFCAADNVALACLAYFTRGPITPQFSPPIVSENHFKIVVAYFTLSVMETVVPRARSTHLLSDTSPAPELV